MVRISLSILIIGLSVGCSEPFEFKADGDLFSSEPADTSSDKEPVTQDDDTNSQDPDNEPAPPVTMDPPVDPMDPPVDPMDPMPPVVSCNDAKERACTSSSESCMERVDMDGGTIKVWRNYSLTKQHCDIKHAVIMIHGRSRNADGYFSYTAGAANTAKAMDTTLIVAPNFIEQNDNKIASDIYWNRGQGGSQSLIDWAMGGVSQAPVQISSYEVLDKLIWQIASSGNFPNLKSIVIAGHSAGGQVTHRYAVSGNYKNQGLPYEFSYVVANPSSYAYLTNLRPVDGSTTQFAVPNPNCSSWNRWGYGLERPNPYVGRLSSSELTDQYINRRVTYLAGDKDTGSASLDVSCSANAQGPNRFE